ncbi:hypothetical protein PVK06_026982 [Gossypium arboreum]|uniref:Uncharacterized protein n=1 Tax=Gossypium arboreum TaxID=29729 RepID=A0ABR0P0D2_GOSAR|nr:hypothetical protein PVK06_026982 [Gossypium arboreum]
MGVSSISRPTALCYDLLGHSPKEGNFMGLKFSWLKANFDHFPSTASEWEVMHAARAYIMHLIKGVPMSNASYCYSQFIAVIPSSAHVHSNLWCISAPVINFQTVDWYHGNRVLRQFGCIQYILTLSIRLGDIYGINKRGKHGNDWAEVHKEYIAMWNNQLGRVSQMDCALDLQPS